MRELNLARQGYFDARTADRKHTLRETAGWIALLLSAQTGTPITQAQLLGEEASDVAGKTADAEKSRKVLERKMKKAGLL